MNNKAVRLLQFENEVSALALVKYPDLLMPEIVFALQALVVKYVEAWEKEVAMKSFDDPPDNDRPTTQL